jgi:hypothetical protein
MSETNTPIPGGAPSDVLEHRINSMNISFAELKKVVERNRELLIETVGTSGKDGKISWIAVKLDTIQKDIEEIQSMFEKQKLWIFKLVLIMLVTSGAGAGIAQVIMDAMGT